MMNKYFSFMFFWTVAFMLAGCIGGYRIDPERVRKDQPEHYEKWVKGLRAKGMTDEELRNWGFKDPLPEKSKLHREMGSVCKN